MRRRAILVLALAGCAQGSSASWQSVSSAFAGPILSAWGAAADDVYFAGGTLQSGDADLPLALHFDGSAWRHLSPSAAGNASLWAVGGTAGDDVWFVGERGTILHWDGSAFMAYPSLTAATLFGVWAAAPDDVWTVGGLPAGSAADQDLLLHFDGTKWTQVDPPQRLGAIYFKVNGTAANDVYVVGAGGLILHYDGISWGFETSGVDATLLSVAAGRAEVLAVGGPPLAVLSRDGAGWAPVGGLAGTMANGVALGADGTAFVVAVGGRKLRRSGGTWIDESNQAPTQDLHAAWSDGAGGAFVVGGSFEVAGAAQSYGVIGHYGAPVPATGL